MNFLEPSSMVLPGLLLGIFICLAAATFSIYFKVLESRVPDAARYIDVKERLAITNVALSEKEQLLREADQRLQDKDRLIAELTGLREQIDQIRSEYASLSEARREIEDVKADAAERASELAVVEQELKSRKDETEAADAIIRKASELRDEIEALKTERDSLHDGLARIAAEYDAAIRAVQEAKSLEARLGAINAAVEEQQRKLDGLSEAAAEKENLELAIKAMQAILRDQQELMAEKAALAQAVSELGRESERLSAIVDDKQRLERELEAMQQNLIGLRQERHELESRKAVLEDKVRTLEEASGVAVADSDVAELLLEDLLKVPATLTTPATLRGVQKSELDALLDVDKYLSGNGLAYSHRAVRAFHTALKINDNAQLTVLAGVSGTGKSMLPRRYAEAMGIHFHQIAVEPRWDSPQDLLGFYNYIEKKYRATDLARLLLFMNPYEKRPEVNKEWRNHLALVLLDEMNLARVEYYFSEFLSRLEVRPAYEENLGDRIKNSLIPIDVRGLNSENSISLYPSHNLLFVGTMNDDESTQALSDKVLDRSNVMQFAAPRDFSKASPNTRMSPPGEAQSFKEWRGWIRSASHLTESDRADAVDVVKSLSEVMQSCGRPFGHRLHDSILAYVANYPRDGRTRLDIHLPLVDQIEFRILPKLRGIEIDGHRAHFETLAEIIRGDLQDATFADALLEQVDKQSGGNGLFVWRGLTRPDGV